MNLRHLFTRCSRQRSIHRPGSSHRIRAIESLTPRAGDVIGTIAFNGETFTVEWPMDLTDPSRRDPDLAHLWRDGKPFDGFVGPFTSANSVMDRAVEVLRQHFPDADKAV